MFVQMLSELEEVVLYIKKPEKQEVIKKIWWDRLQVRCCIFVAVCFCNIIELGMVCAATCIASATLLCYNSITF